MVVVGPFRGTGGVVTFQRNLIERSDLKERWHFVPHSNSRPPKRHVDENLSYRALWNSGLRRLAKGAAVTAYNLARYPVVLRRAGADVVQIQSSDYLAFWESAAYLAVSRAMGVPAVVRFGGSFNVFYERSGTVGQRMIRRVLASPDAIVVQSPNWKRYFSELVDDSDRLNVVPNAVPMPPEPPVRGDHTREVRALFICGENAKLKGIDTVLGAAPELAGHVHFVLVAAGEPVVERVHQLGLADQCTMHGTVPRERMLELYREADVFLIPSHREGFPNSLLEAMAAGLPVVGSPAGAIPEVLEEGVGGFLNAHEDAEGLGRDLLALASDPDLRKRMGAANYRRVCETFELNTAFAAFDRIWGAAIER